MAIADWRWCTLDIDFRLVDQTYSSARGQQPHNAGEQYWTVDLTLPPKPDADTREIEALVYDLEGVGIVGISDPRRPYPFQHQGTVTRILNGSISIPAAQGAGSGAGPQGAGSSVGPTGAGSAPNTVAVAMVSAMSREDKTLTLLVVTGEVITVGDPIGFTDDLGVRHYFQAGETKTASGGSVTVRVNPRPKYTASFATNIRAERVRPKVWFIIDTRGLGHKTKSGNFTDFSLTGIEYFGAET